MIQDTHFEKTLGDIFAGGADINELLSNPEAFAEKHNITDKETFVKGVERAADFVPEEAYTLFQRNPFVTEETKKMFQKMECSTFDDSKVLPVTIATLVLALTAAVVAAKLVKK